MQLPSRPAYIERGDYHFVIMDAPTEDNLHLYMGDLEKYKVSDIVRVCEATYQTERLQEIGIEVHDWPWADGEAPSEKIIDDWLDLVEQRRPSAIAVHCVAGLGRAPVLVAIALIDLCRMEPLDALELIRSKRRGAINARQLKWIETYKPRRRQAAKSCTIQ